MVSHWHCTERGLQLELAGLAAELVLDRRWPGLRLVRVGDTPLSTGPLLALHSLQAQGGRVARLAPVHEPSLLRPRAASVHVQLPVPADWPLTLHLGWKCGPERQVSLELLASTDRPVAGLEAVSCSRVHCDEVLVPVGPPRTAWVRASVCRQAGARWLLLPRDAAAARLGLQTRLPRWPHALIGPAYSYPLVLFRLHGQSWSYVECSHPDDCTRIALRPSAGYCEARFALFGWDLEKGVIVRGRLRGAVVPKHDDTKNAVQLFERLAAEPPPLRS